MMGRSRIVAGMAVATLGLVLAWVGWLILGGWQVRDGLTGARRRMDAGQYAAARDRLRRTGANWNVSSRRDGIFPPATN